MKVTKLTLVSANFNTVIRWKEARTILPVTPTGKLVVDDGRVVIVDDARVERILAFLVGAVE